MGEAATSWKPDAGGVIPGLPDAGFVLSTAALADPRTRIGEVPPFEPGARFTWAFEQALRTCGVSDAVDVILKKAQEDPLSFAAGTLGGAGATINNLVASQITGIGNAIAHVIDFYSLVYDPGIWIVLLQTWTAAPGSGVGDVEQYLSARYPNLLAALKHYSELANAIQKVGAPLLDQTAADPNPWTKGTYALSTWAVRLAPGLGAALQPKLSVLASASAHDLGTVLGNALATLIILGIMIALGLFALIRSTAAATGAIIDETASILQDAQLLSQVPKWAEEVSPGVGQAAAQVSQLEISARDIYQNELAYRLGRHGDNIKVTYAWGKDIRDLYGYSDKDEAYYAIRLDSHHLLKQDDFDTFKSPLHDIFDWNSRNDMDAIVVHAEWHMMPGLRKAGTALTGVENEVSLTTSLERFLTQWAKDKGPINTFKSYFEAHEAFYSMGGLRGGPYSARLWSGNVNLKPPNNWWGANQQIDSVQSWFAAARALAKSKGYL
jgi:hypothetical protein